MRVPFEDDGGVGVDDVDFGALVVAPISILGKLVAGGDSAAFRSAALRAFTALR